MEAILHYKQNLFKNGHQNMMKGKIYTTVFICGFTLIIGNRMVINAAEAGFAPF